MDFALKLVTSPSTLIVHAIQDVAPFIPLISTALCETHVTTALDNGLLYSAAAPMSIFGSLGIAMAGAIALLASIDWPIVRFHGPTHLKNAGLRPTGLGALLLHVNQRKHHLHVAEDRLRTILSKKKVQSVDVNLLSKDLFRWNIHLIWATIAFGLLGLIPYFPLWRYSLKDQPFLEVALPPFFRVIGSATVAVSVQLLFQLRLLEEAYHRLRFLAADTYLKSAGTSLPSFWDPNQRSKSVFAQLRQWLEDTKRGRGSAALEAEGGGAPGRAQGSNSKAVVGSWGGELRVVDAEMFLKKIHRLRSFKFEPEESAPLPAVRTPTRTPNKSRATTQELSEAESSTLSEPKDVIEAVLQTPPLIPWISIVHRLTTIGLCFVQIVLLAGIGSLLYGYVLCFSLVQANRSTASWKGPVFWLVLEIVLALLRIMIWAYNPRWDDPRCPIVLEKVPAKGSKEPNLKQEKRSYGIKWSLSSLTADMHALVIGINHYENWGSPDDLKDLRGAEMDARKMATYLEEKLHVPCHQICTLYNSQATKERIVEELKGLGHRASVAKDAPIVIYYAGHSWVSSTGNSTYLVPYLPNYAKKTAEILTQTSENDMLRYGEIVELLRHIGDEKTENIALILDTCNAGAMAITPPTSAGSQPSPNSEATQFVPASGESPAQTGGVADDQTVCGGSESASCGATEERPVLEERLGASIITQANAGDVLTGHPSHVLLAATTPDGEAFEAKSGVLGGKFTAALLHTLDEAEKGGTLKDMTYKKLIEEVGRFEVHECGKALSKIQHVHCTTIHQDRPLFDGLFSRERDDESGVPVVTVRYSD